MRGVAARYPAFDTALARPVNLAQRINLCRERHQQAAPLAAESQELLALESFVALQSRGLPVAPPADAQAAAIPRTRARRSTRSASASSTSRARNATTSAPAGGSAAT